MGQGRLVGANLGLLVLLGAIWGTSFMFITLGLERFSPVLLAALRFDLAGPAILLLAWARKTPLVPRGRVQWTTVLVAATLNVAGYHALLFWGQQWTTPAVAAVLVGLNPILATVFSRALLEDERLGWTGFLGLGLGLAGVVALASLKEGDLLDARGVGELAAVAAVASWACGSTLVKRQRHGLDVLPFTAWQMLVGAALLHGASAALEPVPRISFDAVGAASLLYLAFVASGLGFVIFFTLLERVGPIRATLVSHVAPVFATLAGMAVLGDPFEARAAIALGLIAGGFALVARTRRDEARRSGGEVGKKGRREATPPHESSGPDAQRR